MVSMSPFEAKDPETLKHFDVKETKGFQCDSIVDGLAALVVYYFDKEEEDDA